MAGQPPADFPFGGTELEDCCVKFGHKTAAHPHLHETDPPDCSLCPWGACCTGDGQCTLVQTADNCPGEYKGDGTDCRDTDGDGLADVIETGNCCGTTNGCNTGTDSLNPDTDGDGIPDGTEVDGSADPCFNPWTPVFGDGFESGSTSEWATGP